jgi:hypothetical protein
MKWCVCVYRLRDQQHKQRNTALHYTNGRISKLPSTGMIMNLLTSCLVRINASKLCDVVLARPIAAV